MVVEKQPRLSEIIDLSRFSTLSKVLRVTAWVKRFVENLKCKREGQDVELEPIRRDEIERAEIT